MASGRKRGPTESCGEQAAGAKRPKATARYSDGRKSDDVADDDLLDRLEFELVGTEQGILFHGENELSQISWRSAAQQPSQVPPYASGRPGLLPELCPVHLFPHGLQLWRETTLGQALIDTLDELKLDLGLENDEAEAILNVFDKVVTYKLPEPTRPVHLKVTSGFIVKYKNLDGIWEFYVSNFGLKDRHRRFFSSFIRIVAAEPATLERAAYFREAEEKKGREAPRLSPEELFRTN